jgi:5,10-methylenetetrahydromethanopterin reductase
MLGSQIPPSGIREAAHLGEQLGFSELWFAEDYFFTGGISGAAAALGATERVPVGTAIVSALVRHPALLAMEVATLVGMFPGRFRPGIGLGLPDWVRQMGLYPRSQLAAVRHCVESVRTLLEGEEVTGEGEAFHFDKVRLAYPPADPVPIYMGGIGPKMLQLSGAVADGTVASLMSSPEYVHWAREQIALGAAEAGVARPHRFVACVAFSVDVDAKVAKVGVRPLASFVLGVMPKSALTDVYGISDELLAMAEGGPDQVNREMPDRWVDDLTVSGDPDECAARIRAFFDAGADSVVLFPAPVERAGEILRLAAAEVLPRVRG